ncbi:MAG: type II secretion system secretin GspD [Oligoflexia bacterium]|nr:type II secretion system secretin GspD [Oligoflexia bacterium]
MKSTKTETAFNFGDSVSEHELKWVRITAGTAGLIGLIGLFALMTSNAHAQTAGFAPGARPFPSPFANHAGAPANAAPAAQAAPGAPSQSQNKNFFDDEDEENAQGAAAAPGARGTGFAPPGGAPQGNAVSGGGSPNPSGVISRNNSAAIPVDAETGEGGREVVNDFNFPDADIMDIAKTLGKLTGKNFIFDKDVKGRISIISNSPITVSDAWKAFLTALDMNQFALIPSGKYIRIARQRDARDKQLRTYTGDYSPDTDALITRVFPLKYIDAEEVARTFRGFMPANSRIVPYEQTNTIIVTDTGANISKLGKMLEILDVEGYDVGLDVISVRYASAAELSKLIDTLIPGTGGSPAGGGAAPRFGAAAGGAGRFSARRTKEGGVINTIIADERTNTLIVNANSKGAEQVRALVARLDQKQPAITGGGKVHVVYLQFADAEQIANTLNSISQNAVAGAAHPPGATGAAGGTGVNPTTQTLFESNVKVSPDKATNALVINASPADFVTVQRVITRLDIPRDEVYVEIIVMEVALNKSFDYSSNVVSPTNGVGLTTNNDLSSFIMNPIGLTGALIGIPFGKQTTVTVGSTSYPVYSVQGLIKLIQSNTKSNVLATPQIIALDNSEANFESAEKIPYLTTTAVQGAGTSQSVSKESVALSIKIKPQINKSSNFVKLDVETKIGAIEQRNLPSAVQNQAYATLERTAKTTVVVGDSDTIVLGGLMRDDVVDTVSKIPILGDIPILGWLFSAKDSTVTKTNLLMFMTPHIVRQYEKVREILDRKLKERDNYIEKNFGGEDPYRDNRDEMIRRLPDIKELMNRKVETSVSLDENQETYNKDVLKEAAHAPGATPPAVETPAQLAPGAAAAPAAPIERPAPISPPAQPDALPAPQAAPTPEGNVIQ